ncbi:MAG TPA: carboxypeptidase-like regulatory domain-containing protein, partial [Thermoanaerobaculia bacterium]|nr:carboxypeptidase-like regulatory domain-containing protein [Thermoanaerobaculia bacterium]
MKDLRLGGKALILGLSLLLVTVGASIAQIPTGNIFVTVTDSDGGALPGVSVTASGIGADKLQITNAQGQVRFLGLDPGRWN